MEFNLEQNEKKDYQFFGDISIQENPFKKNEFLIKFIDKKTRRVFELEKSNKWVHKGTSLGKHIMDKMKEHKTNNLFFYNVNFKLCDTTQPDMIFGIIWQEIWQENIIWK